MQTYAKRLVVLFSVTLPFMLGAASCTPPANQGSSQDQAATPSSSGPVVAKLGEREIHQSELDSWIKERLFEENVSGGNPQEQYQARASYLDAWITQQVIENAAKEAGQSEDEYLSSQSESLAEVSDADVQNFFDENQERLQGQDFETVAEAIRGYLIQQKTAEAQQQMISQLREQAGVEVLLDAPRVEVAADGASMGPESAPITIIEFSDYQCPFCVRAEATVKQVLEQYGDQIRFVYRHFPLESIHPQARPAARAAFCAQEQNKFWEYHNLLFANSNALGDEDLERYAAEVGLEGEAFRSCLEAPRSDEAVTNDLQAGSAVGVSGTPAFFVNGIMLSGAQPFEAFESIIKKELANTSS